MTSSTLTTTPVADVVVKTDTFSLTKHDRCDACGSQAYFKVVFPSNQELTFCNHHFRASEAKLVQSAKTIYDESVQLNPDRRSVGNGAFA